MITSWRLSGLVPQDKLCGQSLPTPRRVVHGQRLRPDLDLWSRGASEGRAGGGGVEQPIKPTTAPQRPAGSPTKGTERSARMIRTRS